MPTRIQVMAFFSMWLVLVVLLSGCNQPDPVAVVTLKKNPDLAQYKTDQQIHLSVDVTGNYSKVEWKISEGQEGTLSSNEGLLTTYTTPDKPGTYGVELHVISNGINKSEAIIIKVVDDPSKVAIATEEATPTGEITLLTETATTEPTEEATATEEATPIEEATATPPTEEATATPPTEEATPTAGPIYEPLLPLPLAQEVLAAVQQRGEIVVGVRFDAPPFGFDANFTQSYPGFNPDTDYCLYHEDFEPIGFDINLVREFAQRWLGDSNAVKFVPVPANKRIDCVENQRADFIAAAFTGCGSAAIGCSQVYVQDLGDFLVRSNPGFEINGFCDISGKKVAVLDGTSAEPRINKEFAETCPGDPLPIFPPDFPVPATYTHRDDAIEAVENGVADMYVTDRLILEQYTRDRDLNVAGIGFGVYEFHMATPANHRGLLSLLNQTLQAMKYDDTYNRLYGKNKDDNEGFGCDVTPYNLKTPIALEQLLDDVKRDDSDVIDEPCPNEIELALNSYTIQSGDTLYELAGFFYGDINYFECIQKANEQTIPNPHRIQVGSTIVIPPLEQCQQELERGDGS